MPFVRFVAEAGRITSIGLRNSYIPAQPIRPTLSFAERRPRLIAEPDRRSMYQRLVSSSVLAGFLVAQWAAMPHGHAHREPPNHNAAPHIHLSAVLGSSHNHDHRHAHGPSHVHRHAADVEHERVALNGDLVAVLDHDEDALYLPISASPTADGVDSIKSLASPILLHVGGGTWNAESIEASQVASLLLRGAHAPSSNVCLAMRALRI
jgi:hypothetical protein